ncbi:DUF397 domain-containing protein [Streptomyces albus]|uniref:DUF397 domain-containing protein n=1 Tax=Streptomyces albus TaxID=1888 RepID=A0A8H1LBM5_9ACTN|nr:DUF397 domain-containing protein [Streptomyces albus]KPC97050.1 hypothetical protein ADL27_01700 [Streptomyces sp. NRRL F-6602]TGG81590.1 DUF397 domain-containing protein [Streptomyces albus]UVN55757.1 DUF397 domain-containing protein [Streptomyces albus]GHJ21546.1 hypothetical protein TPA0909_31600 [Streptomyces albus]GHJ21555.1 hypothetical protein TPA0909_31690 [Streptomyces albus]
MNDELESAVWFKSSRSNGQADCIEVAFLTDTVATRDTKDRDRATLTFGREGWQSFIRSTVSGHFDRD